MPANNSLKKNILLSSDPSKVLVLTVGHHQPTPGTYIKRADAQQPPALSFAQADPSKTYLAACLDLDAPFQTFPILGPILHWIQSGFKRAPGDEGPLQTSDAVINSFVAPAPPPGSGPHRYLFMLYEQPASFDATAHVPEAGKRTGLADRVRFDWDAWERKAGLGVPVAVNYFTSN